LEERDHVGRYEELSGAARIEATGFLIDKYGPTFTEAEAEARRGRDITPTRLDGKPEAFVVYAIHVDEVSGRAEE
jgi:hypothetical protein